MIKQEIMDIILKEPISIEKNLHFTADIFINSQSHFFDIKINSTVTDDFYKTTHTGKYSDLSGQTPWILKTTWIKALIGRSKKTCSHKALFEYQLTNLRNII